MNKITKTFIMAVTISLGCSTTVMANQILKDELVESTLAGKNLKKPYSEYRYNYESTRKIPIQLSVIADVKSEKELKEGQDIVFKVHNDVWRQGKKIIKKGDLVYAKVETIITSGMNGIPASIVLGDFKFENIEDGKIMADVEKYGQDRSLILYPMKWALTILPPTGTLTNFIKGGHAKLKTNEIIEVYYYPEW